MPNELFENLIRGLLTETPSGVWQQDDLYLPARTDTRVPHIHGRVPDVIELGDIPVPTVGDPAEPKFSYSRWFNPLAPAPQQPMEIVAVPPTAIRPLGAPLVQPLVVSSSHVVVRNWHTIEHVTRLLTMSRLAPMEFEEQELTQLGVRGDFMADVVEGAAALDVKFTDTTTYGIPDYGPDSWDWDFGDAGFSVLQNPAHQYANPGTYTVTLTITFTNGRTCTVVKTAYITAT
jgi:hypothetical protein